MEGIYDVKTTSAYKILSSLQGDNTIDTDTFGKYVNKIAKVHQYLINYMETEKVIVSNLNKLKEENTKTLNDYSVLQKQQAELNDLINRTSEECRKAKGELAEYENTRLLKLQFDIDRLNEQITRIQEQINNNEKEQIESLKKQIEIIQEEINKKSQQKDKLEDDISKASSRYRDVMNLKEKIDLNNEQSKF
jgi:chromosome segregation ATPase